VLYEMAAGKRASQDRPPELNELPQQFGHVVERCLQADPGERWQAASDVKQELEWTAKTMSIAPAVSQRRPRGVWLLAAATIFASLLTVIVIAMRRPALPQTPARLSLVFEGLLVP
jgi:hypothetical protein